MQKIKNIQILGTNQKPITLDIFFTENTKSSTIIYSHGFNGFKDWANFDLIAAQFVKAGFTFIKFNFSHNGTSPEYSEEFVDLEAYAQNNYSTELTDLEKVIDWTLEENNPYKKAIDPDKLFLIGHSMGGGIVLVQASEDNRIKGVATWASVGALKTPWTNWSEEKMKQWREKGVEYIKNSRTNQDMPLNYQLYEDFENNKERLDVENAVKKIHVPMLFCHGNKDEAVPVETASLLASLNNNASVFILETDHVFGRKHPWTEAHLPDATQQIVDKTIEFFQQLRIKN
ncbi:MAG: alpha/beta fold hydrolase [Ginsengibacter sp.]